MQIDNITLAYRRDVSDTSTGMFLGAEGTNAHVLEEFNRLDFVPMMTRLAYFIQQHPHAGVCIQRIDRPGLQATKLSSDEVELFRRDPVEAIRLRTVPPMVIHIGGPKRPAQSSVLPLLDAGYTTLANCFGDVLYVRRKGDEVECVHCGTWSPLKGNTMRCAHAECSASFRFSDLPKGEPWAGLEISDLFRSSWSTFFLPRNWNRYGNWISMQQLQEMHDNYIKEKSACAP